MKLYRVENECGEGPYTCELPKFGSCDCTDCDCEAAGNWDCDDEDHSEFCAYILDEHHCLYVDTFAHGLPTWYRDEELGDSWESFQEPRAAVQKEELIGVWFDGEELDSLECFDFMVAVYEVPDDAVVYSRWQAVYDHSRATRIVFLEFSEINY
jgi:hypothetical protein